jgi:hypothetical protein
MRIRRVRASSVRARVRRRFAVRAGARHGAARHHDAPTRVASVHASADRVPGGFFARLPGCATNERRAVFVPAASCVSGWHRRRRALRHAGGPPLAHGRAPEWTTVSMLRVRVMLLPVRRPLLTVFSVEPEPAERLRARPEAGDRRTRRRRRMQRRLRIRRGRIRRGRRVRRRRMRGRRRMRRRRMRGRRVRGRRVRRMNRRAPRRASFTFS